MISILCLSRMKAAELLPKPHCPPACLLQECLAACSVQLLHPIDTAAATLLSQQQVAVPILLAMQQCGTPRICLLTTVCPDACCECCCRAFAGCKVFRCERARLVKALRLSFHSSCRPSSLLASCWALLQMDRRQGSLLLMLLRH